MLTFYGGRFENLEGVVLTKIYRVSEFYADDSSRIKVEVFINIDFSTAEGLKI